MRALIAAVVLVSGCATVQTPAGIRRRAEWSLRHCVAQVGNHVVPMGVKLQCVRESRAFCRANGLEASCGEWF